MTITNYYEFAMNTIEKPQTEVLLSRSAVAKGSTNAAVNAQ